MLVAFVLPQLLLCSFPREKDRDLTRELIFYSFTEQDLQTRFECIILDPSGVVRKVIKWDYQDAKGGGSGAPQD